MDKKISIKKVSISNGMFLKVSYTEQLPDNDERSYPNVSCSAPVHSDMVAAFKQFIPHLALICEDCTNEEFISVIPEEYDGTQATEMELGEMIPAVKASKSSRAKKAQLSIVPEPETKWLDSFDITSVEFRYTNSIPGIVLTGIKKLSTGKWLGIGPTPLIKENDSDYKHLSLLFEDAELLKYEVGLYIVDRKYAPPVDPELDFPDGPPEGKDSLFNIAPAPKDFTESVAEKEKDSNFIIRQATPDMDDEELHF